MKACTRGRDSQPLLSAWVSVRPSPSPRASVANSPDSGTLRTGVWFGQSSRGTLRARLCVTYQSNKQQTTNNKQRTTNNEQRTTNNEQTKNEQLTTNSRAISGHLCQSQMWGLYQLMLDACGHTHASDCALNDNNNDDDKLTQQQQHQQTTKQPSKQASKQPTKQKTTTKQTKQTTNDQRPKTKDRDLLKDPGL